MPGPWNPANPPVRSGAYTNWVVKPLLSIDPPLQGTVALPFTHDYGPLEEAIDIDSWGQFQAIFGGSLDTPGARAVYQAFKGEGLEGRGGASRVVCYRMGGSSAAKATKALTNVDTGTPVAITLVAKYEGDWAENLKVEVIANTTAPSTHHDLVIYNGTYELERHTYAKADINALKTLLAASDWFDVPDAVVSGFALTLTAVGGAAATGGDDGSTLVSGDWTSMMSDMASKRFGVFVPFNLQDSSIITALKTWVADPVTGLNSGGKRVELVVGGTTSDLDLMSDSLTRATAMDDPNVVVFGGVTAYDAKIVDDNDDPVLLTSSQLAPRIAGIIAARGEGSSTTFARLADITLASAPNEAQIRQSITGGVMTLAEDSNRQAPVRVERGVTSYVSDSEETPNRIYSVLKFVLTMHGVEREITEFAENNVIGRLSVNAATREYLVAQMKTLLRARVEAGIILDTPTFPLSVRISNNPPPSDTDDFVSLEYEFAFGRSLEQVRNTVVVS